MRIAVAGNASSPIWSADGRMLAFVDYAATSQIHVLRLKQDRKSADEKVAIDCPEGIRVRRLAGWTSGNEIGAVCEKPTEFALYTQPVKGGKATFVTHGAYPTQPRWPPDGKRVFHVNKASKPSGDWQDLAIAYVAAEGGDIVTVPIQSRARIRLWAYGAGNRISPDGNTIVFAGQQPEEGPHGMHIWTLPVDGGTPRQLTDAPAKFRDWYPCWSPDGKLLVYFSRDRHYTPDGTLKVIPANGGEPRVVAKVQGIYANSEMAWSRDGKRIAYNAPQNKIKIVSLDDGSIEEIVPDLKDVNIYHLDWSPDGERLVFGGYSGGGPEFWTVGNFLPAASK